jgi:hypothetical protein
MRSLPYETGQVHRVPFSPFGTLYLVGKSLARSEDLKKILAHFVCHLLARVNDIRRAHTMPTATPASQFMWFKLPRIWERFVVPF